MFEPSEYQRAIYNYLTEGKGNVVVSAVAGSGKSTTIINALKILPKCKKILFLAFNKSIVEELQEKIGDLMNVRISTLHSLGFQALSRSGIKTKISSDKCRKYLSKRIEDKTIQTAAYDKLSYPDRLRWKKNVCALVDLARVNLKFDESSLFELSQKHGLDLLDNEIMAAQSVVEWDRGHLAEIDFTDMIYLPLVLDVNMPKYDWVFIDECQDLNAAQRNLFLKCVKTKGRFVAVGDEKQSIYGFCGADAESFRLLKSLPNTVELPLSICYRCDKDIIRLAQGIIPQIQWRDDAVDGEVNNSASIEDVKDGDMVLCRVTAPLVSLCMKYIGAGKKAYVKGRDIGEGLCRMIEGTKAETVEYALEALNRNLGKIVGKLIGDRIVSTEDEAKSHPRYINEKDKIDSISVISEGLQKSKDVVEKIRAIFSDENGSGICLSTVHKSKGLENDRVFILCPDKLPLKCCMKIPWMAEQEINLKYVAYTRAKHYLGFITDF